MKKIVFLGIIIGVLSTYSVAFACDCCGVKEGTVKSEASMSVKSCADGMQLSMMEGMDHSMMKSEKTKTEESKGLQTVEQDGYKFQFDFIDIREKVKGMKGSNMANMTHHLMVSIYDAGGKHITAAKVNYKTSAPGGKEGQTMGVKMGNGFGGNINLSEKGKHTIEATIKIGDKEVLVKTHYETK